jgi:hypothetical protein
MVGIRERPPAADRDEPGVAVLGQDHSSTVRRCCTSPQRRAGAPLDVMPPQPLGRFTERMQWRDARLHGFDTWTEWLPSLLSNAALTRQQAGTAEPVPQIIFNGVVQGEPRLGERAAEIARKRIGAAEPISERAQKPRPPHPRIPRFRSSTWGGKVRLSEISVRHGSSVVSEEERARPQACTVLPGSSRYAWVSWWRCGRGRGCLRLCRRTCRG